LLVRADVRLLSPVEHRSSEQQAELAVIRTRDAILLLHRLWVSGEFYKPFPKMA
jgi:hypothetical protein